VKIEPMPPTVRIARDVKLPDRERLALYQRLPELGPRVLFFTGGTALRALSQRIIGYTHHSIHIVTPFDSGGSSAEIRRAFHMLAVGDLRNRIMALADRGVLGNPMVFELFAYRLPKAESQPELRRELQRLVDGKAPLVRRVANPLRQIIRAHLGVFADRMPDDFNLSGACIGNLILTGGFLSYSRHIDPVVFTFSKLVEARGDVAAVSNENLHLVSELEDGSLLVGQHRISGKESPPIDSPIKRVYATDSTGSPKPVAVKLRDKVRSRILHADLICYPMGSFYSSVIANLLPPGVGDAIRARTRPKVYVPNAGTDPEAVGLGLLKAVRTLLHYLQQSCSSPAPADELVNILLLDPRHPAAKAHEEIDQIREMGIQVVEARLITEESRPYYCPHRLVEYLLSLA
jgi:CofD-related protein of GAK system